MNRLSAPTHPGEHRELVDRQQRFQADPGSELEDTYFRWLRRTDERLLATFDAYDEQAVGQ